MLQTYFIEEEKSRVDSKLRSKEQDFSVMLAMDIEIRNLGRAGELRRKKSLILVDGRCLCVWNELMK